MKKEIKLYISIIFMMIVAVFILPTATIFASTSRLDGYVGFEENFKTDFLELENIRFIDNSKDSTMSFGLVGKVKNISDKSVTFKTKINYYDNNLKLITSNEKSMEVPTDYTMDITYVQMASTTILPEGYSASDIYKYSIDITEDYTESKLDTNINSTNLNRYDYYIENYDVQIIVNENNTFDIIERINTYFNVKKHGIFRKIPLKNTVNRLDGTTSKNKAKVTSVLVLNDEYETSKENGNYVIKIGSASKTITGEKDYTIKYHYNIGKDNIENYDELYFNIIGTEWDTCINNVTFKITMPKEFDVSKLGFSLGNKGSTNNDDIIYTVSGNVITGEYTKGLKKYEGLTIRLELPDGYFVGYESTIASSTYVLYGIPVILLIITILLWSKYGKDKPVIETVEFYPPEGYNSLEVGFLYKGNAENEDVVSLLIYLANKGYIKITEVETKGLLFKSKTTKIIRLKPYDGNNLTEKLFMNGLFKYGRTEVELDDLTDSFYTTMNKILRKINTKNNKHQIFEKSSLKIKKIVIFLIVIAYVLITVKPIIDYYGAVMLIPALIFPGIGLLVLSSVILSKNPISIKIFILIWSSGFIGIPWMGIVYPALLDESTYLIGYILGAICILGMILCNKIMPKRTDYGTEILGKIKGFKNFLETVEKERLETLVMDNPTYFYDILPYTYVLGVSDKWIKKFETIGIKEPDWYSANTAFSVATFGSVMTRTMSSAKTAMTSSPSSSSGGGGGFSGGGSSGGGSSGGGSGGGGGGSW